MRGFFGRGVYNEVETEPGGGEGVHEQDMIALLQQHDERGMDALLLHCGPLMRGPAFSPSLSPEPPTNKRTPSPQNKQAGSFVCFPPHSNPLPDLQTTR